MASRLCQVLLLALHIAATSAFVDFGTITQPFLFEPTFTVPRPHQLPDDVWMRYETYHSHLTAVAPSVKLLRNGSLSTSWSIHSQHQLVPTRTLEHHDLRKRGVFSGDPAVPTCRQCDSSGNPINNSNSTNTDSGSPSCSVVNYDGVFQSGGFGSTSSLPDYCFDAGYTGPLLGTPQPTNAGLPCCPVCYPPGINNTYTGVLSTTPGTSSTTSFDPGNSDDGGPTATVTVTVSQPTVTITQTTLSIETITPSATPVTSTGLDTIVGCGTASGCGTVIGDGTVYLAPFGFPAVTSSGTVSGCAPTIIGCGTMIASTGIFTGTASLTGCGEGRGCATMIGSGTVWPTGFMDMISFVSSGTLTGCGRVKGCGYLTGTGTFTVCEPFTTTVMPEPTVNVYVSYCPPDSMAQNPLMRMAGNVSDPDAYLRYATSPVLAGGNYTQLNFTGNSTMLDNPLCHVCPEDSGICCPLGSDCGSDGHCPWTALEGSGYARFGVNLVAMKNSSDSIGMTPLPAGAGYARLRAPGLPGSKTPSGGSQSGSDDGLNTGTSPDYDMVDTGSGLSEAQKARRGLMGGKHGMHDHIQGHPRRGLVHGHRH